MSKVRRKNVQIEYKKNDCFFYEPLWSRFSFFSLAANISKFSDGIKENTPNHQTSKQRGTCIKGLFWPPLEPKTESCFSPNSSLLVC